MELLIRIETFSRPRTAARLRSKVWRINQVLARGFSLAEETLKPVSLLSVIFTERFKKRWKNWAQAKKERRLRSILGRSGRPAKPFAPMRHQIMSSLANSTSLLYIMLQVYFSCFKVFIISSQWWCPGPFTAGCTTVLRKKTKWGARNFKDTHA